MAEWILPFKGRGRSGLHGMNFLWKSDRVYVMDNHRAALWCWLRHISDSPRWQLLHLDRHYDTLSGLAGHLDMWLQRISDESTTIDEYLSCTYDAGGIMCPVFRSDNYLSVFLKTHGQKIVQALFATAGVGDKPVHPKAREISPWEALEQLEYIAAGESWHTKIPWIVNVDLDYFTAKAFDNQESFRVFDDAYVNAIGRTIAKGVRGGQICCATIALSPETTGGWAMAERLMETFLAPWGENPNLDRQSEG